MHVAMMVVCHDTEVDNKSNFTLRFSNLYCNFSPLVKTLQ